MENLGNIGETMSRSLDSICGQHKKVARLLWLSVLLVLMISASRQQGGVEAARKGGFMDERQACTRQASRWSCILGCFKCAETYGRKVYDMASCCGACQATKAVLIDDGPEVCSMEFFVGAEKIVKGYNDIKRQGHQALNDY